MFDPLVNDDLLVTGSPVVSDGRRTNGSGLPTVNRCETVSATSSLTVCCCQKFLLTREVPVISCRIDSNVEDQVAYALGA